MSETTAAMVIYNLPYYLSRYYNKKVIILLMFKIKAGLNKKCFDWLIFCLTFILPYANMADVCRTVRLKVPFGHQNWRVMF